MPEIADDMLAEHWLKMAASPAVRLELESVYADASEAIRLRGPACWASGRCCNFESAGHLLYVTGLEAAYTIAQLPERPTPGSAATPSFPESTLRLLVLEDAKRRGGCPFQAGNLCGVHTIKPLGCRVYFCDRSAKTWQQELSERLIERVRALHDRFSIEYRYGEWRQMLRRFSNEFPAGV